MSQFYNCKAACGSLGPSGEPCNYYCPMCGQKCEGKYARSLKESIGKVPFTCLCINKPNTKKMKISL